MTAVFSALEQDCTALGTRLFTITTHDLAQGLCRRVHTSHPVEYPAHGTKPLARDAWYDLCITGAQPFVANTPAEFATVFFDHALITSMGLGSPPTCQSSPKMAAFPAPSIFWPKPGTSPRRVWPPIPPSSPGTALLF